MGHKLWLKISSEPKEKFEFENSDLVSNFKFRSFFVKFQNVRKVRNLNFFSKITFPKIFFWTVPTHNSDIFVRAKKVQLIRNFKMIKLETIANSQWFWEYHNSWFRWRNVCVTAKYWIIKILLWMNFSCTTYFTPE